MLEQGRHPPPTCHDASILWREAGRGFGRLFRAAPGFESWQLPSAALAISGVPAPDLNCGVIGAGEGADEHVFAMLEHLRRRRLPGLLLAADVAGPKARVAAETAGLMLAARLPLMGMSARDIGLHARGFTVRRVTDAADLARANRILAAAFDLPR